MIISFYIITEKMKIKNIFKKSLITTFLSFLICILLSNTNSYAAKKTTAFFDDGDKTTYFAINDSETIILKNKQKKATYKFTSSNKKVATVSKKGVVKGVSAGKAKIIVNQILKKKKTKIATLTVNVEKAVLYVDLDINIYISNQPGYYNNSNMFIPTTHDISGNIHACKLEVETGYQSGPVTLTVLYKGKEVGSVTINVISTDNDEYDDNDDYGDNDDYNYYEEYDY